MFIQQLPNTIFNTQREFIKVMNANKDFTWWAETLITEETKELKEAVNQIPIDMSHVFKEFGDLIYVIAGFYNTMPSNPHELLTEHQNETLQNIIEDAYKIATETSQKFKIPPYLIEMAFNIVHTSNMSKLDENGEPIRRKDGKIMKGPDYVVPDMSSVVETWQTFVKKAINAENVEEANKGNFNDIASN